MVAHSDLEWVLGKEGSDLWRVAVTGSFRYLLSTEMARADGSGCVDAAVSVARNIAEDAGK